MARGQNPQLSADVGTGRPTDTHLEPDADQLVRVAHLQKPTGPLPAQEQSEANEEGAVSHGPPIADVKISPGGPSVWEG
ncbi:MAG: hypothetical protein JWO33_509 [Caulobacteraceae bacterium]|nr:hypothetical protein [Caulobacteraceae bacterium]